MKYAAHWKTCSNLLTPVVSSSPILYASLVMGYRSVQDVFQTCRFVAVTVTRKSAVVAAVSVDL
jgi:hypothetical protein